MLLGAAVLGATLPAPPTDRPAGGGSPEPSLDPGQLELIATAQLARMMHQPRTVNILVTNHGDRPVPVATVELRTGSFAPTGPVDLAVTIPAGNARALPVIYGQARCDGQAAPPLARGTVILTLATPDPATVELSLPDQDDELLLLLGRECAVQRVSGAVQVGFRSWSAAADGTLRGELVLHRRDGGAGDEPVVLDNFAGNVLFRLTPEPAGRLLPLGELAPGEPQLVVGVHADTNRCDGHAVGEAKQRFLMRVWVSVGADVELPVAVELDPADHALFAQMQQQRCGL